VYAECWSQAEVRNRSLLD